MGELRVVETTLQLVQLQAALKAAPPVWLCTTETQPISYVGGHTHHAGLWGLARAARQETLQEAWCVDLHGSLQGVAMVVQHRALRLSSGRVRGLQESPTTEPEAALHASTLHVPRLVAPYAVLPSILNIGFEAMCCLVGVHTVHAQAALETNLLVPAYARLETLCQQYILNALRSLVDVPAWHHKLLLAWCAKQVHPPSECTVLPVDVRDAHPNLWAEVQLAKRCGSKLADALSGSIAYQELLFPGGSMDAVLPVYEHAVVGAFYNGCVVAAVEALLELLPAGGLLLTTYFLLLTTDY